MSRRALLFLIAIIICCFQQCKSQFSDDACSTGVVITEENGLSGTISTPNYPDDYDNNLNCTWIIQAPANKLVEVQIQDFLLESCDFKVYDFLDIYDGETLYSGAPFCGDQLPLDFESSSSQVRFFFSSDFSEIARGFQIKWTFTDKLLSDVACSSGVIIPKDNRSSGIISSPNYPDNYYNNLNCNWTIQAPEDKVIAVRFVYFMLEDCSSTIYDYLQINDGEELDGQRLFCESEENNAKNFVSSTNQLRLRFVSDSSVTAKGFNLTWQFKDVACISGVIIPKDNRSSGIISSPNYPDNYYNNLNCNWTIQAPEDNVQNRN
ncbi:unnamed protein product [Clavelina lepadiformis]|uniref:CUB domain-containing protein n=1 Tax=Clavelina lepadiformis TaxID=159417 RepID=A0ABP0GSF9_CLALP